MNHIMLDLETLDTKSSAIIVSVGLCEFDANEIGEKRHFILDMRSQAARGRTISVDTAVWWMGQTKDAQIPVVTNICQEIHNALDQISHFIRMNRANKALVWGNGSDFDNVILGSLYDSFGLEKPWSFGRNRCFRTMKNLPGAPGADPFAGEQHNALDDAINQAKHLQKIIKHFNLELG